VCEEKSIPGRTIMKDCSELFQNQKMLLEQKIRFVSSWSKFYGCHTLFFNPCTNLSGRFFIAVHFFLSSYHIKQGKQVATSKRKRGSRTDTLQENCCTFIEQQWGEIGSVSLSDITPAKVFFYLLRYVLMFSFPPFLFLHVLAKSESQCFLDMVGNIWSILVEAVNTNLYINQTIHKIDKRRKPTSIQELQQFYGIIILMENTYGNNTQDCRTHFFILKTSGLQLGLIGLRL